MERSTSPPATTTKPPDVIVHGKASDFLQKVVSGKHHFQVDEPMDAGGTDAAPTPYDYLVAALGACTSMTIGWYARKRNIPLEDIRVSLWHSRIHAKDCEDCITKEGMIHRIELEIALTGALTPEQHSLLMEAAEKCPVHRTLTSEIDIKLRAAPAESVAAV
jgi:putative redox protein